MSRLERENAPEGVNQETKYFENSICDLEIANMENEGGVAQAFAEAESP